MIVKTGANYQTEGGYIEASVVDNKIITTINDREKKYPFYETSVGEMALVPITISKSANAENTRFLTPLYRALEIENGGNVYDYQTVALTVTPITGYFVPTDPMGVLIDAPAEVVPKLADGSKDCKIVKRSSSNQRFIISTGPNPVAIIDVE